ncbi:hypothetical protein ACHAPQ_010096 [Fusarium lateritium]
MIPTGDTCDAVPEFVETVPSFPMQWTKIEAPAFGSSRIASSAYQKANSDSATSPYLKPGRPTANSTVFIP